MRETVSFYLDLNLSNALRDKAKKENRTLSQALEVILEDYFDVKAGKRYSRIRNEQKMNY